MLKWNLRTPSLGEREVTVLGTLWREGPLSAQQVLDSLPEAGITLNTVQSTLERLCRKKLLTRRKSGRAFIYTAVVSRSDLIGSLLRDITADIADGSMAPVISGFVDLVSEDDKNRHALESSLRERRNGGDNNDD